MTNKRSNRGKQMRIIKFCDTADCKSALRHRHPTGAALFVVHPLGCPRSGVPTGLKSTLKGGQQTGSSSISEPRARTPWELAAGDGWRYVAWASSLCESGTVSVPIQKKRCSPTNESHFFCS